MRQRLRVADMRLDGATSTITAAGLSTDRWEHVSTLTQISQLPDLARQQRVDVVIVDAVEANQELVRALGRTPEEVAVALFAEHGDDASARAAVSAGVCACVIGPYERGRLETIVSLASARFEYLERLRRELQRTRAALAERKVIERAKGMLMREYAFPEDEAYRVLQKRSMDTGQRLIDVAQSVLERARPR
jgi:two-component system, response regulator / RNA-binding antiterminator